MYPLENRNTMLIFSHDFLYLFNTGGHIGTHKSRKLIVQTFLRLDVTNWFADIENGAFEVQIDKLGDFSCEVEFSIREPDDSKKYIDLVFKVVIMIFVRLIFRNTVPKMKCFECDNICLVWERSTHLLCWRFRWIGFPGLFDESRKTLLTTFTKILHT